MFELAANCTLSCDKHPHVLYIYIYIYISYFTSSPLTIITVGSSFRSSELVHPRRIASVGERKKFRGGREEKTITIARDHSDGDDQRERERKRERESTSLFEMNERWPDVD